MTHRVIITVKGVAVGSKALRIIVGDGEGAADAVVGNGAKQVTPTVLLPGKIVRQFEGHVILPGRP